MSTTGEPQAGPQQHNIANTASTADYLAQLLKDKKQLQAFPNVFLHMERLLDDGKSFFYYLPLILIDFPKKLSPKSQKMGLLDAPKIADNFLLIFGLKSRQVQRVYIFCFCSD